MASRCQQMSPASIVTTSKRHGGTAPPKWLMASACSHQRAARPSRRCLAGPILSAAVQKRVFVRSRTSMNTSCAPSRITRSSSPAGQCSWRASSLQPAACSRRSAVSSPASPSVWRGERRGVVSFAAWPGARRRDRQRTARLCAALAVAKSACVSGSGAGFRGVSLLINATLAQTASTDGE